MDVSPLPSLGGRQPLWLDDLVLAEICRSASSPAHLARIAAICSPLKLAATRAARKRLHRLLERLEVALPSCAPEHSFPIVALMRWEAFEVSNVLWYRADELFISSVMGSSSRKYVKTWMDRSGHNLRATAVADKGAPLFNACAINGHGALEFSGSSVLQSQPFSKPLPQPITIMVVARARGDTTIVDSLGSRCMPQPTYYLHSCMHRCPPAFAFHCMNVMHHLPQQPTNHLPQTPKHATHFTPFRSPNASHP